MLSVSQYFVSTAFRFVTIFSILFSHIIPNPQYLRVEKAHTEVVAPAFHDAEARSPQDPDEEADEFAVHLPFISNNWRASDLSGPDVAVSKTTTFDVVQPGGTIDYQIAYENRNDITAAGVYLTETLPDRTTIDAASLEAGWQQVGTSNQYTYQVGAVSASDSGSIPFSVTVQEDLSDGIASIANTVTIHDDGASGSDPEPSNNYAYVSTPVQMVQTQPDLVIGLSAQADTIQPGDTLTYTVMYANNGSASSTSVVLAERIPDHAVFNSTASTSGWTESDIPGDYEYSISELSPASEGSLIFAVDVANSVPAGIEQLTNTATIDDDHLNGIDPTPGDNADTYTIDIDAQPDLSVSGTPSNSEIEPGDAITYTIAYVNNGNQGASGVHLMASLPGFLTSDDGSLADGWQLDTETGNYRLETGELAVGASGEATLVAVMDAAVPVGVEDFSAAISIADDGANGEDPNLTDNAVIVSTACYRGAGSGDQQDRWAGLRAPSQAGESSIRSPPPIWATRTPAAST